MRIGVAVAACVLVGTGTAEAQQLSPEQAALIEGDPAAAPQRLELRDLPKATGPADDLFNGRNLAGWLPWLGFADTSVTFRSNPGAEPLGTRADWRRIFSVEQVDGGPVIKAGGNYWGSLASTGDYGDFHLSLEYRWGAEEPGRARNNGVVYLSHGAPGAAFGTWMTGMEFQLEHGSNGMAIPMGRSMRAGATIAQDRTVRYPFRVYRLGGRAIDLANVNPAYSVEHASDAEKPAGEWNRIDLYVVGNRAIHVVNGVPVMMLTDIAEIGPDGKRTPVTKGHIQLQAEGGVTYFRNIRIEPIKRLPRLVAVNP
ncbi:DUF1080 domain-containing protein [Sphingomonas sp.]|uniref:3-keto-disaccharide hydrolase n=1 Tax=Sphingomonas sp. TaxID=28214 RepID=UPI001B24800B|nr:DUF1080 domain-containing protein [Sphingomonas sp.]MBO9714977.1 DUF1080 domain-containing protein [Sphingomonas sp.]